MQSQCSILTFGHQDTFHTSQLSKVRELSFGQPPPSLKTSHTESVKASHSVRSTSRSQGHCKAMLESPNCCLKDNFCHIHKEIHILKYLSLGECLSHPGIKNLTIQKLKTKNWTNAVTKVIHNYSSSTDII